MIRIFAAILAILWGGMQLFMIWAKQGLWPLSDAVFPLVTGLLFVLSGVLLLRNYKYSWLYFWGTIIFLLIQAGINVFGQH